MSALRSVLASALLAVLAMGGVVLPSVHHAAHGLEVAETRDAHVAAHHDDAADADRAGAPSADAPCPPAPNDVDCAVCVGLSSAADPAVAAVLPEATRATFEAHADWVRAVAATGAGARAPPVG